MTNKQTPEDAVRKIRQDLALAEEELERTKTEIEETAQETYEFRLDAFHGEQGHQRIQRFADDNRIPYREAMKALDSLVPKAPKPIEVRRPLTEARIAVLAKEKEISYREAMLELSNQGYALDLGGDPEEEGEPEGSVDETTAAEEREMLGASHEEIGAYAQKNKLSYRDAMIELSSARRRALPNGQAKEEE